MKYRECKYLKAMVIGSAFLVMLAVSCSSEDSGELSAEAGTHSVETVLSELGGSCEPGEIDRVSPLSVLTGHGEWLLIHAISNQRANGRVIDALVQPVVLASEGSSRKSLDLVHPSEASLSTVEERQDLGAHKVLLEDVGSALAAGLTVWGRVGDEWYEGDGFELMFATDGRDVAFLGECSRRMWTTALYGMNISGGPVEFMSEVIVRDDAGRASLMEEINDEARAAMPRQPQILSPGYLASDELDQLSVGTIEFLVPDSWVTAGTICTRVSRGWNECVPLREGLSPRVLYYVDPESPALDVMLMDAGASLIEPVGLLGSIDLRHLDRLNLVRGGDAPSLLIELEPGLEPLEAVKLASRGDRSKVFSVRPTDIGLEAE